MSSAPVAEPAPAKLNLYLHVTGRRETGYHELDSLVAFAETGDVVEAYPAEALSLTVDGPQAAALAEETDNLVLRAARALAAAAGVEPTAALRLDKRLPVASGIGGGSADAAATLRALVRLWRLDIGTDRLAEIALDLGADVPVCVFGRSALMRGIGEQIAPAPPVPAAPIVLVNPNRALSTPAVFNARRGDFSAPGRYRGAADAEALAAALRETRNDLTAGALALEPAIGAVLAALDARGALLARMSGSGASCFGIFGSDAAADAAADRIGGDESGWWVTATRLAAA